MTSRGSLEGRLALITGAGGDIGRAVAIGLAEAGADLVIADRPVALDALDQTVEAVAEAVPSTTVRVTPFDVTDPDGARAAMGGGDRPPDLLVNNAGVQGAFANTLDAPLDDVLAVLDVNVVGVITVLQAFARALVPHGRTGAVVNTASMAGVGGAPNMLGYSASKAAVIGLTKTAAKDLAPHGIRVNAISPAFLGPGAMWTNQVAEQARVASPYYGDDPETVAAEMIGQVPLRRYGRLDEVASVVRFLLSDEASYLTGVNIEIAGGAQ